MTGPVVLAMLVLFPLGAHPVQATSPAAQTAAEQPWPPPGVFHAQDITTHPIAVERVHPRYTPAARDARIEGMVIMEAVVRANGTVGEVRVTRSLDTESGLDDEEVRTLKLWRFKPATSGGVPVPVLVTVEMEFKLPR